jgi:hypothetical protein
MAKRRKKTHDIDDTALAPYVIADGVVGAVAKCFGQKYGTRADANRIAKRAEVLYKSSESFRKKMNRKDPRGLLAAFMQHWHAANLVKRNRRVANAVGESAWHGTRLSCPVKHKR